MLHLKLVIHTSQILNEIDQHLHKQKTFNNNRSTYSCYY